MGQIVGEEWLLVEESGYTFSKPIHIRTWAGGYISVKVGYVRKHPERNCIYLEKRWKGRGGLDEESGFYVKDGDDWLKIKGAVEKLWPELSEIPSSDDIDKVVSKIVAETKLLELIARYPELLSQIPDDIDILSLPESHKEAFKRLLEVGGNVANSVINRLAKEPIKDLEAFSKILEELKLSTINSLITHITSRIGFIDMFEKAIHNDESYEVRGKDSIHNLLKVNIWIVDRNYSVLHDDETLKNIILAQWQKNTVEEQGTAKRPDFLCMVDPLSEKNGYRRLIIIEIKRPTVKIELKHINQVMEYREILQKHSGKSIDEFTCYIIGREVDSKLQVNDLSKSGFIVKTYTDFISEARRFYQEYLKVIEEEKFAF